MKIFLFLFFFLLLKDLTALETECRFEEVYSNGEIQQGLMMIQKENLRYQYLDPSLYTIINNPEGLFVVSNKSRLPQPLDTNKEIIEFLITQSNLFPKHEESYSSDKFTAKIIKSNNDLFIKNIVILSETVNVNIHFHDCKNKAIDRMLFKHNPLQIIK
jgi:hypothetical protein